jgi:hypothetical protein
MNGRMSAIGPKRTSLVAPHMSAFGGKADMTLTGLYVRLWPMAAKRLILRALSFPVFQCFTILFAGRSSGERDARAQQRRRKARAAASTCHRR